MFLEPNYRGQRSGWIEVICGSMFSGKTEELIRRLNRAKIANQKVQIFKPLKDDRYHETAVVSHNENAIESLPIAKSTDIYSNITDVNVVGVDEAQFFDSEIIEVCQKLAISGIRSVATKYKWGSPGKEKKAKQFLKLVHRRYN